MTTYHRKAGTRTLAEHDEVAASLAKSAAGRSGPPAGLGEARHWLAEQRRRTVMDVRQIPLDSLTSWRTDPATGDIVHASGRFFAISGLDVERSGAPVPSWQQPIIEQPEVGVLGILVREFDGVLHCLMQAKAEPGNCNRVQLSPTVQATRSNYTRVHEGASVPYLEFFQRPSRHRVLVDVRQSEQGSWFHGKHNRNMVVQVDEDVAVLDGFRWLTLREIHGLFAVDDAVNMDTRTVLSCLPYAGPRLPEVLGPGRDPFTTALLRSCSGLERGRHSMTEILSWITDERTRTVNEARRVPLKEVAHWQRRDGRITHSSGLFFNVIGVSVTADGREIAAWSQPLLEPCDEGVVAFLAKPVDGVLHLLVHARAEPGFTDVVELGPTVQCTPSNYDVLPPAARPPFLDEVLHAEARRVKFDAVHSEEGGRLYHARNRYVVVEAPEDFEPDRSDYRWLTLAQLSRLLRHSNYVNVQARSLVACLHSMTA
ncbi:NDP-hexose 2,3-dehydratase family protein [Streptomyces mutabilis]|uniref:NDP-hexose 2,3-dehydratase family protein n=1 Tax=Streptomyces mutabilis TaxID=67332 RepID=UPI0022BA3826|nr:NDP-hexose 2,3-dehydratase family protein [Streptomyces mutabilis]MCZ9353809.1 NDP-hexose 2,3-dehydratase family protein [Streptomyces mutabilis]